MSIPAASRAPVQQEDQKLLNSNDDSTKLAANLPADVRNELYHCIYRYAYPKGRKDTFHWILFRTFNIVKSCFSVFGCCGSDGQRIHNKIVRVIESGSSDLDGAACNTNILASLTAHRIIGDLAEAENNSRAAGKEPGDAIKHLLS